MDLYIDPHKRIKNDVCLFTKTGTSNVILQPTDISSVCKNNGS